MSSARIPRIDVPFAMLLALLLCLGACSTDRAARFARDWKLPDVYGPLLEVRDAQGRPAGWLYGSVHYGPAAQPMLSRQALTTMGGTRHVYIEVTDDEGSAWNTVDWSGYGFGLSYLTRTRATAEQAIEALRAERRKPENEPEEGFPRYIDVLMRYCDLHPDFGTESMVLQYLVGQPVHVKALETSESRRNDVMAARTKAFADAAARGAPSPLHRPPLPSESSSTWLDGVCRNFDEVVAIHRQARISPELRFDSPRLAIAQRNQTMTAGILRALAAGEKPFVIVGAAHLEGPQSIQTMLKVAGYEARELAPVSAAGSR